jgi:serine/threonine protein kinase
MTIEIGDCTPATRQFILGDYTLSEIIGRGGMGEVWAATYMRRKTRVAVKVLTATRARDPKHVALFRNEVRTIASLDHPSIIQVYDHGQVTRDAALASNGVLVESSPYLVMERLDTRSSPRGSLLSASSPGFEQRWTTIKRLLLDVLDALAHAHARGVIHRDIKPSNVLLASNGTWKLTDFGIAHVYREQGHDTELSPFAAGTAGYMAPEQIASQPSDLSPRTDLYSLGCLAFALATGAPPFAHFRTPHEMRRAHIELQPPRLGGACEALADFDAWIARLLARSPRDRFSCAADAAWALEHIEVRRSAHTVSMSTLSSPTTVLTETAAESPLESGVFDRAVPTQASHLPQAHDSARLVRPFASSWRLPSRRSITLEVLNGLGLHALRATPLVGRADECDRLWSELAAVTQNGGCRAIVLRGAAGVGKSRLSEWLCDRAYELGAAEALRARYGPSDGSRSGVVAALLRHFRVAHLPVEDQIAHVAECIGRPNVTALMNLMLARQLGRDTPIHDEEVLATIQVLTFIAAERPLIVWLDDVHWAGDAIELAQRALESLANGSSSRLLFVLTVREEALVERPLESEQLARIEACAGAGVLEVGPIGRAHWPALIEGILGLRGDLAVHVEERTAGNPLFAVQLVGDWVQRRILVPTEDGLAIVGGCAPDVPDEIHAVWAARIGELAASQRNEDVFAMEIAASLGQDVDAEEWQHACTVAGIPSPHGMLHELMTRKLVRPGECGPSEGFSFVHGMFRESIERLAKVEHRARRWHLACAAMLEARYCVAVAERYARHLLHAGEIERAVGPLATAIFERLDVGDVRGATALVTELESSLTSLRFPDAHTAWCEAHLARAQIARYKGRFGDGHAYAQRAREAADKCGSASHRTRALLEEGQSSALSGAFERASVLLRTAMAESEQQEDRRLTIDCMHALADALVFRGDPEAGQWYMSALRAADEIGDVRRANFAALLLALISAQSGAANEAIERIRTFQGVQGANSDGSIGKLSSLRSGQAHQAFHPRGLGLPQQSAYADLFLGRAELERRAFEPARAAFERSVHAFMTHHRRGMAAAALVGLFSAEAALGQFVAFSEHVELARSLIEETKIVLKEIAMTAVLAGDLAVQAGESKRAEGAYAIAMDQALRVGDRELAASIVSRPGALLHAR